MTQQWNSADKEGQLVISGTFSESISKSGTTNNESVVRATTSSSTTKFYWEIRYTNVSGAGNNIGCGIAAAGTSLTDYLGHDDSAVAYYETGSVFQNNNSAVISGMGTIAANDWVAFACDFSARHIWIKNLTAGGNWNASGTADPATDTGGYNYTGGGFITTGFPAAVLRNSTSPTATANFGDVAYVGTVPSGFSSFNSPAATAGGILLPPGMAGGMKDLTGGMRG